MTSSLGRSGSAARRSSAAAAPGEPSVARRIRMPPGPEDLVVALLVFAVFVFAVRVVLFLIVVLFKRECHLEADTVLRNLAVAHDSGVSQLSRFAARCVKKITGMPLFGPSSQPRTAGKRIC
jgi:hypothetical protein